MPHSDKLKMAEETEKLLRSVLQSCKNGVALAQLASDYNCITGDNIPFRNLGYSSLENYLKSIPNVVKLISDQRGKVMVEGVPDKTTKHIADLVSRQRGSKSKAIKKISSSNNNSRFNINYNNRAHVNNNDTYRSKSHYEKAPRFLRETKQNLIKQPIATAEEKWWPTESKRQEVNSWSTKTKTAEVIWSKRAKSPEDSWSTQTKTPDELWQVRAKSQEDTWTTRAKSPEDTWPTCAKSPEDTWTTRAKSPDDTWPTCAKSPEDTWTTRAKSPENQRPARAKSPEDSWPERSKSPEESRWHKETKPPARAIPSLISKPIDKPKPQEIKRKVLLPTPTASIYSDKWRVPKTTLNGNASNLRTQDLKSVKDGSTCKEMLEQYTASHRMDTPIFSIMTMSELNGHMATVKVNGQSFSSYPLEGLTLEEAREIAAKKAIEAIGCRTDLEATIVSTNVDVMFARIKQLLQSHPNGIVSGEIPVIYKEKYIESLPAGWLKIIMDQHIIPIGRISDDRVILYPEDESEILSITSTSTTTDSDDIASADSNSNCDLGVFLCHAVSTKSIFVRLVDSSANFEALGNQMEEEFKNIRHELTPSEVFVGRHYAAHFAESWHRVQTVSVHNNKVLCKFIDNGDYDYVNINSIQPLKAEFLDLRPQALECKLNGLEEYAGHPTSLVALQNECGNTFIADIKKRGEVLNVILYDTSEGEENVNEKILAKILEADIAPTLPDIGIVCDKPVYLSHVLPNGNIYVQIQNECYDVVEELLQEVRQNIDEIPSTSREDIKIGTATYIARYENEWYRARIDRIIDDKATVFFIDFGNTERISIENIKNLLPVHEILPKFPPLAFECKLFGIPLREDLKWTSEETKKLQEIALDEYVLLKVVIPATSQTIPAVEIFKRIQPDNQLVAIKETLMLDQKLFRSTNSTHKRNSISAATVDQLKIVKPPEIPDIGVYLSVQVALTASPWNFRCQLWDTYEVFETLTAAMQDYYDNKDNLVKVEASSIEIGSYYACKHLVDQLWYRVQVKGYDATISVISLYYIDFGDTVVATVGELQPLLNMFKNLPYQAIFCKLAGIAPKHKDWQPEDCIRFQNLVENRKFVAEVCNKCNDEELLIVGVKLIDTSSEGIDTDIGQIMIEEGRALKT